MYVPLTNKGLSLCAVAVSKQEKTSDIFTPNYTHLAKTTSQRTDDKCVLTGNL